MSGEAVGHAAEPTAEPAGEPVETPAAARVAVDPPYGGRPDGPWAGSGDVTRGARPVVEPTGDERVDTVLRGLAGLDTAPVSEHVTIFENLHRSLQEVLGSVEHDAETVPVPRPGGAVPPAGASAAAGRAGTLPRPGLPGPGDRP